MSFTRVKEVHLDSITVVKMAEMVLDTASAADTVAAVTKLYGLEGINAGQGFLVSSTGMLIVFAALAGIATIIGLLPKLMTVVAKIVPETVPVTAKKRTQKKSSSNDDEAVAVAIALANHSAAGK